MSSIDYIKRFVLFLESRFNNLTSSVAQTTFDMDSAQSNFMKNMTDQFSSFEGELNKKIYDV